MKIVENAGVVGVVDSETLMSLAPWLRSSRPQSTLMHLEGVPIAVIAAWLGHASSAFTMATYAHSQEPAPADAARRLARVVTNS